MKEIKDIGSFVKMGSASADWAKEAPTQPPVTIDESSEPKAMSKQEQVAEVVRRYQMGEATMGEILDVRDRTGISPVIPTERFTRQEILG